MSFWDDVYALRKQGLIPRVWKQENLRQYMLGPYTPNSINTIPPSQSIAKDGKSMGNHIKNGREPMAWQVGPGEFELVMDPDDNLETQHTLFGYAQAKAHIARAKAAGSPYPLRGLPLKYERPYDPVYPICLDDPDTAR